MKSMLQWAELPEQEVDTDLYEFRAAALRVVLWLALFAAFAVLAEISLDFQVPLFLAVLVPVLLALPGVGRTVLSRHGVTPAALVTIVGLLAIAAAAMYLRPFSQVATWLCAVVIVASATLGTRASLFVAAAEIGLVVVTWLGPSPVVSREVAQTSIGLIVTVAALCWVASSPIYVALEWAWHSYERARQMTEELRDRQGELGRVVKSLNEAYFRLEALNDELAHARRAAEEARRLKSEFAANISHELRTPLNLIIGFSEMMATSPQAYGDERLPSTYRSDLDAILRNARHLSTLIDDVLDLSQIEAGRMGLTKEEITLGEVIAEATGAVSRLLSGKGLALTVDLPPNLPRVYADRTRIRQVVINLLSNAARFTDQGGIAIRATADGSDLHVSVADTGIGIPAQDIPKVFEAFRQLDGSIRRRESGSGLGLAVSKQFVELHGGSMWAESKVGEGTVFRFTLPLSSNVVTTTRAGDWQVWERVMASRPTTPPEVKVVSADPSVPRIFQRYLDGYSVSGYSSVEQVPRQDAGRPGERGTCVVVVGSSAQEAWDGIASCQPGAENTTLVACALPSKRDLARELGAAAYLVKPVSRDQVVDALDQIGSPQTGAARQNVLIVDDDTEMLRLLGRWVRSSNKRRRAWLAEGGDEALAILRSRKPDVVLMDLLMPGTSGYAVLEEMRSDERLRDVPVVVVTARDRDEQVLTAGLLGITRRGGLSVNELMRCLRASLDVLRSGARSAPQEIEGDPVERPA